jgi:hypothetical protein
VRHWISRVGAWIAAIASAVLIVVVILCAPKRSGANQSVRH